MSVRVEDAMIQLSGRCLAEDAEALLVALRDGPEPTVDIAGATHLHLAVLQLLLAARPQIRGIPDNDFAARYLLNLLQ